MASHYDVTGAASGLGNAGPALPLQADTPCHCLEECQDLDRDAILKRIDFFNEEIAVLENRIQPHDTGHIKTAICVLKARKQEIEDRRDGHPGWLNEYLIGGKS